MANSASLSVSDRERLDAAIMQVVDDCIVAIDEQGQVIEFNPAAEATFGWQRDAAIGRPLNELIVPPVHRAAHQAGFTRYLVTGEKRMIGRRVEIEAMCVDGTILPVEISIVEVPSSTGRLFAASLRDVSERRRVEIERQRELARLTELVDALPIGIFLKDRSGRYLLANLEARRQGGSLDRSWIGLTDEDLFRSELAARFRAADQEAWASGQLIRSEMPINYTGVDGTFISGKVLLRLTDGSQALLGYVLDITARKVAEDEVARQRQVMHQAEKMSALGSLLASVAHELNNPLSIILGHAVMLQEEVEPGTELAELLARVHHAAERCARIVKTFLDMARQRPAVRVEVQLNDLVRGAVELMAYGLRGSGVEVELVLDPALPTLAADGDQLVQVLVNLIVNAQQAMHGQEKLRRLRLTTRVDPGAGLIILEVADSGPGIPPKVMERLFEPFFTTKPAGVGTGLGMMVCRSIVQAHQGNIVATAGTDGGALIRVELPIRPIDMAVEAASSAMATASLKILVVDDEPDIAAMLARILRRLGHMVEVAADGTDALVRIAERPFDILISDIRMPSLDGPSLWRRLVVEHPKLAHRTLFMTGDTLSGSVTTFLAETGVACIEKPFRPVQVRAAIAALLGAASPETG